MNTTNGHHNNAISRRKFLAQTGIVVAGAAGVVRAEEPKKSPLTIGSGHWTYTLVEGWGAPPEGMKFEWGCAIVVDSQDRVYVHSQAKKAVVVYDRDGRILTDWGAEFAGKEAHGLYWSKEGKDEFLYFSHLSNAVVKTDLNGKVLLRIGNVAEENSTNIKFTFNKPTDLAIAPNGDLYVCEGYGGNQVHVFSAQGKYKKTIGKPGSGPGEFKTPHGIWVDTRKSEPELYVADRANGRVQIFSLDGEWKREIKDGIVRNPCCFYEFKGKMFVPDLNKRVTVLDEHDQPVAQLGDGLVKEDDSTFRAPHALTVDSHGDLYVFEWVPDGRLRKFKHTPQ